MRRLTFALLALLFTILLTLWAGKLARAASVRVDNVCSNVKFKGRGGELLLICPINATQGTVVLKIANPCQGRAILRAYWKADGETIYLVCGDVNPLLHPPPVAIPFDELVARTKGSI